MLSFSEPVGWVKQPLKLGVADLKPEYEPGSFGFDPLGLYPKVRFEIFRLFPLPMYRNRFLV